MLLLLLLLLLLLFGSVVGDVVKDVDDNGVVKTIIAANKTL